MKKRTKKLTLSRETVTRLDDHFLVRIAGGAASDGEDDSDRQCSYTGSCCTTIFVE